MITLIILLIIFLILTKRGHIVISIFNDYKKFILKIIKSPRYIINLPQYNKRIFSYKYILKKPD